MPDVTAPDQIPPGFKLRHTLRGGAGAILRLAWSPDGRILASAGRDGVVELWDAEAGTLSRALKNQRGYSKSIAWSPDGRTIALGDSRDISFWDATTGQLIHTLHLWANVFGLAWSPDGWTLAAGSDDGALNLWNANTRDVQRKFNLLSQIASVAWSPDGQNLAAGLNNGGVYLWSRGSVIWRRLRQASRVITQSSRGVKSLAWSLDGRALASATFDGKIEVWDVKEELVINTIEGHTASINSVSVSFNGHLIASKSQDGTVRLWRYDTGENVAILDEPTARAWTPDLAFHPNAPVLATLGDNDTIIRIWDLDFDALLRAPSAARGVSYTNAKVVLVGDTGVGKTGLGLRLAEKTWRPTESTHGMNVWTLHSEPRREVMLWDFAGQDEYRLVHQLFLNETNVTLMLYDPSKSDDTFEGINYWEKALNNAVSRDVQKILVAARTDVGGVRMTEADIEAYCKANGYLAHFPTSAEKNEGCDDLRAAILKAVPWGNLPRTSSPEVFKRIKDFLADVRQGNRILVREADLRAEFKRQASGKEAPTEDEFRTVIGHVETAGLIKRLSFGDFVLLKPELLNGYASDIVNAARRHPAGLGAVSKADVLGGRIRLKDEGGLGAADKIFMLHATVELFLRLGLALEQDGNLVFPSKFNRRMPPLAEDPAVEVEFSFEGPVENLYTTLVVKLYYGGVFKLKKLWKNAAEFLNGRALVCGFQLHNEGEGHGTLKVFYAEGVSDDDKALFLKFVADHFGEKGVKVERRRIYRCPQCREMVRERGAAERALARNRDKIFCQECGGPIPLIDALEVLYHDDPKFRAQIKEMETRAEANMERGAEAVAAAAELRTENFKTWAANADIATIAIVFTDMVGGTGLNVQLGDEPWQQVSESHFARARELIRQGRGYPLKTKGDGVIATFHDAGAALDFALALLRDPGGERLKIRAGIHIGPVGVSEDDVFGQQVNMVARIEAKAEKGGVWVSEKVKEDVGIRNSPRHRRLKWTPHPDEELKGFEGRFTLWSVEE